MSDDLVKKVENAPRLFSRFAYALLSLLLVAGCAEKQVEIQGKVTEVRSFSQHSQGSIDEETGKYKFASLSGCSIYVNVDGVVYSLNIDDTYDNEVCNQVLEAATGTQCCLDSKLKPFYEALQSWNNTKPDKRGEAPVLDFGQCEGVKCTYSLGAIGWSGYDFTATIEDPSKAPSITLIIAPSNISDSNLSDSEKRAFVYLSDRPSYGMTNHSTLTIHSSQYESDKAMETATGPIMSMFKRLDLLRQSTEK